MEFCIFRVKYFNSYVSLSKYGLNANHLKHVITANGLFLVFISSYFIDGVDLWNNLFGQLYTNASYFYVWNNLICHPLILDKTNIT